MKRADILTPNVTECCLLTDLSYEKLHSYQDDSDYIQTLAEAGQQLQQDNRMPMLLLPD